MSWLFLFFVGLLEVAWAVGLKINDGRPLVLAAVGTCFIASIVLLGLAMREIPLGTAYAIWTGIGIIGTFLIGALFLGEPLTLPKIACTALIAAGIAGLKLSS